MAMVICTRQIMDRAWGKVHIVTHEAPKDIGSWRISQVYQQKLAMLSMNQVPVHHCDEVVSNHDEM